MQRSSYFDRRRSSAGESSGLAGGEAVSNGAVPLPTDIESTAPDTPVEGGVARDQPAEESDDVLLLRFIEHRDPAAFTAIVLRYERLVLGVALRQMGDRHRAEDVFQATFLVLAENARKIRNPEALACWLHGTARRIGIRALGEQQRTRPMTDQTPEPAVSDAPLAAMQHAFEQQALDEELEKLPEHLRLPLMLHYLDGLTAKETADRLALSVDTVEGRIRKGRSVLRERLMRHGVGFSIVIAAFQLSQLLAAQTATTSLAATSLTTTLSATTLSTTTINSALAWANHQPLVDCTANAVRLASQELAAMTAAKLTTTVGITAALCLTLGLGGALAWGQFGGGFRKPEERGTQWVQRSITGTATDPAAGSTLATNTSSEGSGIFTPSAATQPTPEQILKGSKDYRALTNSRSRIEDVLESTDLDVEFIDTPIQEAVDYLGEQLGIPISIDVTAFHNSGSMPDDLTISAVTKGLSAQEALNVLVERIALNDEDGVKSFDEHYDYIIKNGILTITTRDVAEEFTEVVIYDTRHLGPNYPPQDIAMLVESLHDNWVEDGYSGTIKIIPGGLVVKQTQRTHREIKAFLKQLEQFAARTDLPPAIRDPSVMQLNGSNWDPVDPNTPNRKKSKPDTANGPPQGFFY
ncbi:MAG: sigma-70 family RNA polymerase sigma factor [Planctomycetaceae bacterium]